MTARYEGNLVARLISETRHLSCTVRDILLSDTITVNGRLVLLLGPEQPNDVAFDLATLLKENRNVNCDVVLKDLQALTRVPRSRAFGATPSRPALNCSSKNTAKQRDHVSARRFFPGESLKRLGL